MRHMVNGIRGAGDATRNWRYGRGMSGGVLAFLLAASAWRAAGLEPDLRIEAVAGHARRETVEASISSCYALGAVRQKSVGTGARDYFEEFEPVEVSHRPYRVAIPITLTVREGRAPRMVDVMYRCVYTNRDRKSTRLNSSHYS